MFTSRKPSPDELPSTSQLLRSTAIAACVAVVILFMVVLPAEYAIDPTGVGRLLGLTQMGEIKMQLAREAATEDSAPARGISALPTPAVPPVASPAASSPASATSVVTAPAARSDEVSVTLKPGQAAEVKVEMRKGARITYRWTASGGRVNFDTHGDPYGAPREFYHGYGKGLAADADHGVLEAAFDGFHGWFWRNRTKESSTISLRIDGHYLAVNRVL